MLKKLLFICLCFSLSACYSISDSAKPAAWVFDQMPKETPPLFQQAWIDGCKSGLSSMTNTYYKTFYAFTQDKNLLREPLYYKTWKDTFTFCRHYIYGTLRQGNVRMKLPMDQNIFFSSFMGTQNIFESGPLQNLGPSTWGLILENWGQTAGDPFYLGMGWALDFSDDMLFTTNSSENELWTWDFRPTNHSIVPYFTDPQFQRLTK